MTRLDRHDRLLVIGFAAIAGYVDAVGFLASSGFFISFMSGNSTRFAVGLASGADNLPSLGGCWPALLSVSPLVR
jgi:uncharacterized membrane protein YoaK (UPF0700 family)